MIKINNLEISQASFTIIAGPCAIESYEQLDNICNNIYREIDILRGGAFKPRTSPNSFQGLKAKGLEYLVAMKQKYRCIVVSEVMDINDLDLFKEIDILQIGARNMQNYPLLSAVGKLNKPVILKRGMGNTVEELLKASQYISDTGNKQIMLCERGIRTFETSTRFTLDLSAVPVLKTLCDYPIIVDPSHAAGRRDLVIPLAKAAKAVGANGIMIEVHDDPNNALSDNLQQLDLALFDELLIELEKIN